MSKKSKPIRHILRALYQLSHKMYFSHILALSFATLSLSHPSIDASNLHPRDDIPYGAFPTSSSADPAKPTPPPSRNLGHAIVNNHCNFPIYIWSVGTTVEPVQTVLPNHSYSEEFRDDPNTGGIAVKISTDQDGLYTSAPQMVFSYNLSHSKNQGANSEQVWYNLSDVFGDPFAGYSVSLTPAEPAIHWENGVPPAGSQVRVIASSADLVLSLC